MQAFVLDGSGTSGIREVPDPVLGSHAVVSMRAAGVCGTDVHLVDGVLTAPAHSIVLGHEGAGVLEYVPAGSAGDLTVGDRVVIYTAVLCGRCPQCLSGHEETCASSPGQLGFSMDGVFSDRVAVPVQNLLRVPDEVPLETAAVLGCAGLTAVHAVRSADLSRHDVAVVTGAGGVSTMTIQVAKQAGAEVIAVTRSADRVALLRASGADQVIVLDEDGYRSLPDHLATSGRAPTHVIDVVGSADSIDAALNVVRANGTVLLVGATNDTSPISTFTLLRKQVRVVGSLAGSRRELALALRLAARGRLVVPIDRRLPLAEAADALDLLRSGSVSGRNILTWNSHCIEPEPKEFS